MKVIAKIIFVLFTGCFSFTLFAQGDIENLLYTEVDNLNPVYKPVVGFGIGTFSFLGEVREKDNLFLTREPGFKLNVATFVDNKQYLRANFFFMKGALEGGQRNYDPMLNMNFRSDIMIFGVNLNYDFDNFFKRYQRVHPFISVGFEMLTFKSMTDSFTRIGDADVRYHYWSDGTIRNMEYSVANLSNPSLRIIQRDYIYETNLRETDWGLGSYSQYALAIPVDFGLDFWITNRLMFRVGTSYNITFSDVIDHVSSKNTSPAGLKGDRKRDDFLFTYATIHLDLFSSKKTLAVQRLFADIELDLTLIGDSDGDGYMDGWDKCPGTPFGVETDTNGCPLDDDFDGIPNYLDDEPYSRYGAYVNDRGVEMSEDELISLLNMSNAVRREDVELYLRRPSSYSNYKGGTKTIPEKFRNIDSDADGYISFDEILNEIDKYFDFGSRLSSEELYELNNFFFSQ